MRYLLLLLMCIPLYAKDIYDIKTQMKAFNKPSSKGLTYMDFIESARQIGFQSCGWADSNVLKCRMLLEDRGQIASHHLLHQKWTIRTEDDGEISQFMFIILFDSKEHARHFQKFYDDSMRYFWSQKLPCDGVQYSPYYETTQIIGNAVILSTNKPLLDDVGTAYNEKALEKEAKKEE